MIRLWSLYFILVKNYTFFWKSTITVYKYNAPKLDFQNNGHKVVLSKVVDLNIGIIFGL